MKSIFKLKNIKFSTDDFVTDQMNTHASKLLKFYKRQKNYFSCSVASIVPVINSTYNRVVTNETELLNSPTLKPFLNRFTESGDDAVWGVSLCELSKISKSILKEHRLIADVTPVYFRNMSKQKVKKYLRQLSSDTFIIANFSSNFGIGHFSPVAGYDESLNLILIADTFNGEPYFISLESFIFGCSTKDGKSYRGILKIKVKSNV